MIQPSLYVSVVIKLKKWVFVPRGKGECPSIHTEEGVKF